MGKTMAEKRCMGRFVPESDTGDEMSDIGRGAFGGRGFLGGVFLGFIVQPPRFRAWRFCPTFFQISD